jgi:hypothetical protein
LLKISILKTTKLKLTQIDNLVFKTSILTLNKTHTDLETKNMHQSKHQKHIVVIDRFQNYFIPKNHNHKHIFLVSSNINNKLKSGFSKEKKYFYTLIKIQT